MERLPFQYQKRSYWEYYCPICSVSRRSFYWPSPRRSHYFQLFLYGAGQTAALWPWFGIKGLSLFLPVWAIFEFFYRSRARQSIICSNCGFDPYLFKFDVDLAKKKVEAHFKEREERLAALKASPKTDQPVAP